MMKIARFIFCWTLLSLMPFTASGQEPVGGQSPTWTVIDENPGTTFSYDKAGTGKPREGILLVPVRVAYSEEGKAEALSILNNPPGMANLAESRYVYDLDCKKNKMHLLRVTHLDSAGKQIKSVNLSADTEWEDIPLYSRFSELAEVVCVP